VEYAPEYIPLDVMAIVAIVANHPSTSLLNNLKKNWD
jgi:hypothetical protein